MRKLGKTWSRIAEMGWEERRVRLGQEVQKRVDEALYRFGVSASGGRIDESASSTGKFFFSSDELPGIVSLVKERMPDQVERVVGDANEICRHRFRLLVYGNLDYGGEIDWHLDAVHGRRAPLRAWFKINFLNFDEVGDHKVIWELNRHQHLVTLAKAWCFTGDARYGKELQTQWHSWQRANPYPIGINWGSSLEVAFRSLAWIWTLFLLSDIEADFRNEVIAGLALNGRYIERYLSTYFSPNTHLLGEAVALFFIGTLFPQIAAAHRWRNKGWEILLREAQRQVRSDGVYFEQSLYYHVYALDLFLHARILAGRNGMTVPAEFDDVLKRMLGVLSAVSQAGVAEGFGDDDGGRVFDPRRNRSEHLMDPLVVGSILFQQEDLKKATRSTEEAIWLFGEGGVTNFDRTLVPASKIKSSAFEAGGIYVMASGMEAPLQMVIDAGPQGTARSGHGHADALSVTLAMEGRRWLVDSGSFGYVSDERDEFRGTGAHNTMRVDGVDQAVADRPFAWRSIPDVHCEEWIAEDGFALFEGSHTGYLRLADAVRHRRQIFYVREKFWLIRDLVEGEEEHDLEINWHFAQDILITAIANGVIATQGGRSELEIEHSGRAWTPVSTSDKGRAGTSVATLDRGPAGTPVTTLFSSLALLSVDDGGWKTSVESVYISPAYGVKERAPLVRSSVRSKLPNEHGTLLVPLPATGKIGTFKRSNATQDAVSAYSYDEAGEQHWMIFAGPNAETWSFNDWTSDARFFYYKVEQGQIADLILCRGGELKLGGIPVPCRDRALTEER